MYHVGKFYRWHLDWLGEKVERTLINSAVLDLLERAEWYTVSYRGDPIMCGGLMKQWPGRYSLNAYMGKDAGRHMTFLTRGARRYLDKVVGRMEFTVRKDFPAGQRWARMLGFEVESPLMKQFGPEGEDHIGYVRIN